MGFLKTLFGINESKEEDIKDIEKSIEKYNDEKLIDLHFKLNSKIKDSYEKRNKDEKYIEECIDYCKKDIKLYEEKLRHLSFFKNKNTKMPSFQRLSIIYEKQKKYKKALGITKKAIKYNLREKNKNNFKDRLKRLENKLNNK